VECVDAPRGCAIWLLGRRPQLQLPLRPRVIKEKKRKGRNNLHSLIFVHLFFIFCFTSFEGKMTDDLVLDSRIRDWVLLPIALVMFLIAILRNNISLLLHSERKPELQKVQERYATTSTSCFSAAISGKLQSALQPPQHRKMKNASSSNAKCK
jgi:hypothetical protein